MLILIIATIAILGETLHDAIRDNGNTKRAKWFKLPWISALIALGYVTKESNINFQWTNYDAWDNLVRTYIFYVFYREAIFDFLYNIIMGYKITHAGTTTPIMSNILGNFKTWQWLAWKLFCLFMGVFMVIKAL